MGGCAGGWVGRRGWVGRGRARFGARFFRERFRKVRFWARFSSPFLHVFSGRCVFGHVFLHLFCTFFPEGAFLGTFFFTFSARFLARGFLGFPGIPYLFLQVYSKFFSGFFSV